MNNIYDGPSFAEFEPSCGWDELSRTEAGCDYFDHDQPNGIVGLPTEEQPTESGYRLSDEGRSFGYGESYVERNT